MLMTYRGSDLSLTISHPSPLKARSFSKSSFSLGVRRVGGTTFTLGGNPAGGGGGGGRARAAWPAPAPAPPPPLPGGFLFYCFVFVGGGGGGAAPPPPPPG